ncbi:hypothetical protein ACFQ1S_05930 [Kibdelosporangium lantanae]|uniref:DUF2637 domain-containing protein n=1 Tax=Kibdelosporangium lantanae TaxID=1497396 RepID=A0ABW3M513_9PSEU
MTTPDNQPKRRAWISVSRRRRLITHAQAVRELATAERDLLDVRQDTARFEDAQRAMAAPVTENANGNEREPKRWPIAKILGTIVISLLVLAGTLIMAAVAIGMQIGFFTARLPESVQTVELPVLHVPLRIPSYAPVSLEAGAWLLTLMVLMLVMCRLRYGRWHRSMLYIASSVAVVNGWHTGRITHDLSTGVAFGALSILGPWIVHLYVQFLRQLVAGDTVTDALADTGNRLATVLRATVQALVMVLRYAVLGVLFHPIRSIKLVRAWSDPANVSVGEGRLGRVWRAELMEHDERLRARLMGVRERIETNTSPRRRSWHRVLSALFGRQGRTRVLADTFRPHERIGHTGEHGPVVSNRPDTPLAGVGDDHRSGGVLTAVRDPDKPANDSTNADRSERSSEQPDVHGDPEGDRSGVRGPFDQRSYLTALNDDEQLLTELNALIDQFGSDDANGDEQSGKTVPDPFTDHHNPTPPTNTEHRSPALTSDDTSERSNDAQSNTTVHTAADTTKTPGPQALIVRHYWLLVDQGTNVQQASRAQIARDLGLKQGTVRRTWNECLRGEHLRPTPHTTNSPSTPANDPATQTND